MPVSTYRSFRAATDSATIRLATLRGREQVVIPVVALVGDVVVQGLGSTGPEFVPASVLAQAPPGWNGRPVVPFHPTRPDGTPVSANEPAVLEAHSFGQVFNARYEGGRLKVEAWLDSALTDQVGPLAQSVLARCKAHSMVEVSVGCFVTLEEKPGTAPDGTPYTHVWVDVVPDHLAMLPEGTVGACSAETGCGAPRAAQSVLQPSTPKENTMPTSATPKHGLLDRVLTALGFRAHDEPAGQSDVALREALYSALRASVPGFEGIMEVFPDSATVIAMAMPEDQLILFSTQYTLADDGTATLGDLTEVEPVTTYKPVVAAASDPEPEVKGEEGTTGDQKSELHGEEHASCSCLNQSAGSAQKGTAMSRVNELVGRLIANERSPFNEEDRAVLATFSEARLDALVAKCDEIHTPAPLKPLSREEWLAQAPKEFRDMHARFQAEEAARRTALVTALVAAQKEFTQEELEARPTAELERLARVLALNQDPADYSGIGLPTPPATGPKAPEDPQPYTKALEARRKEAASRAAN